MGLSAWGLNACERVLKASVSSTLPAKNPTATFIPSVILDQAPVYPTIEILHPESTPTPQPSPTDSSQVATGIYTPEQLVRLQTAALRYRTETEAATIQIVRLLGYLKNGANPDSLCGPLTLAILRDAELVSAYVDLHDFWFINPRPGLGDGILERVFPRELYYWYKSEQSVADFDFQRFPLKAGDVLYLFAGLLGTFEHLFTVSRVDEQGRAYAVTNLLTAQGYIIQEVMLYDPHQPGSGQFAAWTDQRNRYNVGATGFGGFQLWRRQAPLIDPGPLEKSLASSIDDLVTRTGGTWRILFKELDGQIVYARQERHKLHPASVIKVPIAMLFLKSLEMRNYPSMSIGLAKGFEGRSFDQLLRAMLVNSEEDATESLLRSIAASAFDISSTLKAWGAPLTDVYLRLSTTWEIATLFEGLYMGRCLKPPARQMLLELMKIYTPGDDLRLGSIHKYLPPEYQVYNKRGTIINELLVLADAAILEIPISTGKCNYAAAMFAYQGQPAVRFEDLEQAMQKIAQLFWEYTQQL